MKKGYKECPFCANEIKEKAIKCQFCWEFLNSKKETKWKETKSKPQKKECPFCLNKIDTESNICPFCDEILNNKPKKEKGYKENKAKKVAFDEAKIMNSKIEDLTPEEKGIRKAITYIDRAFWWGCFSILLTVIIYIVNLVKGTSTIFDVSILDIIYWWVLVYFMYKRDRMAALFFFIEFVLSSILILNNWNAINGFRILIAIFLFMWIIWAFNYHSLINQKKLSKSEKIILIVWIVVTILSIVWLFVTIL